MDPWGHSYYCYNLSSYEFNGMTFSGVIFGALSVLLTQALFKQRGPK